VNRLTTMDRGSGKGSHLYLILPLDSEVAVKNR
jgi:hypothetical protein